MNLRQQVYRIDVSKMSVGTPATRRYRISTIVIGTCGDTDAQQHKEVRHKTSQELYKFDRRKNRLDYLWIELKDKRWGNFLFLAW